MGSLSGLEYLKLLILRPVLGVLFVIVFILIGWFVAWKLVMVHVPLVQEIFGLRKKPVTTKGKTGRFSKYYSNLKAASSSTSTLID